MTYSSIELDELEAGVEWQLMFRAVVAAGGVPLAIDCATAQPRIRELVQLADALIVLGGGDVDPELYDAEKHDPAISGVNPVRDRNEMSAIATARENGQPILAICRGFQLLNVVYGGGLIADLVRDRPGDVEHRFGAPKITRNQHTVTVESDSKLAQWMSTSGPIDVNSEHHQGILTVGAGLRATAHAPDGLVEAVEDTGGHVVGIQWHPEFTWPSDGNAAALLSGFIQECAGLRRPAPAPALSPLTAAI
ncbi:gamma-glutamyl-gamma-aminobutyrate hydrolase family protein [Arthrobacter terricola]|nr:gamma-glutamyl-gamma-aminobutyrate hydrolase family protein [Arthrobacter terricola]